MFQAVNQLEAWNGSLFFSAKKDNLWGLINDKGKVVTSFKYDGLAPDIGFCENGFFIAKLNGSQGLVDALNHVIVPFKYKNIYLYKDGVRLIRWDSKEESIRMDKLVEIRNEKIKKEREESEQQAIKAGEEAARKRKEYELSSFTAYAKRFVEPKVNKWQNKGEFEKMADYQKRVTGPNRSAMVDSLTQVAEKRFIDEHIALKHEKENMRLDVYDSENEVFSIETERFGKLIVPVPISDGPDFKSHFLTIERKNPVLFIENDKIALASLDFYDSNTGKTFRYSNGNALSYNHYNIDPDSYKFELVSVVTAKKAPQSTQEQVVQIKRPVLSIVSPATNSSYSNPNVTIRYQVSVFDGSVPSLSVWINGEETTVSPKAKRQTKGVAAAWDEIELTLPKDRDHTCKVMLSVIDGNGLPSEPKTIVLSYAGEVPKPNLYLFAAGISNYRSSTLPQLSYAAKDAKDFVKTICSSDLSMYERVVEPIVLTDASATKANIEKKLDELSKHARQDDVVMLFFSGHGVPDGDDTYFMSVDANGDDPYTGVDFAFIRKKMRNMKNNKCRVLVFMDACYSGAMFNTKSALKTITLAESDIIGFYSSNAGQTSAEFANDGNGLFTSALLKALKGEAKNKDGEITTTGLHKYVSDYVTDKTRGAQHPIIENPLGDIVLFKTK